MQKSIIFAKYTFFFKSYRQKCEIRRDICNFHNKEKCTDARIVVQFVDQIFDNFYNFEQV